MRPPRIFKDITSLIKTISAPDYLIDELIELDTIGAIIGASAVGKSFLAIDLSASVATGTNFAGKAVKQGKVLYLAGEGLNGISRRFAGWVQHKGTLIQPGCLHVSQRTITMDEEGAKALLSEVQSMHPDIKLVVIDTLARYMDGDENSNRDMNAFIAAVDTVRKHHGCAVVIVHHTGHASERASRARGASSFYAALDFEFLIQRDKHGNTAIKGTKNKEEELYPERAFGLKPVAINGLIQANGTPVTTAVVEWGVTIKTGTNLSPSPVQQTAAFLSLVGALEARGIYDHISLNDWREHAYQNSSRTNQDSRRAEFNSFKNKLLEEGVIEEGADGSITVLAAKFSGLIPPDKATNQGPTSDANP